MPPSSRSAALAKYESRWQNYQFLVQCAVFGQLGNTAGGTYMEKPLKAQATLDPADLTETRENALMERIRRFRRESARQTDSLRSADDRFGLAPENRQGLELHSYRR